MHDNNDMYQPVVWTPEMRERLTRLWFAWYKVSEIADILKISQAAVSVEASRRHLGYRDPLHFRHKRKRDTYLEAWPPVPVTTPRGGRPSALWPPGKLEELLELRRQGLTDKAISEKFGPPYTKNVVLAKRQRHERATCSRELSLFFVPKYLRLKPKPALRTPNVIKLPYVPLGVTVSYRLKKYRIPGYVLLRDRPLLRRGVIRLPYAEPGEPLILHKREPQALHASTRPPRRRVVEVTERAEPKATVPKPPPMRVRRAANPRRKVPLFDYDKDQAMIEEYLRTNGVTVCKTVYLNETQNELTKEQERQRLNAIPTTEKKSKDEIITERKARSHAEADWRRKLAKAAQMREP